MNTDNRLGLRVGGYGIVLDLPQKITVFVPTTRQVGNARIVSVDEGGSIKVHWLGNYNLRGDFGTELMSFNSFLILNKEDKKERNKVRKNNGLQEIK